MVCVALVDFRVPLVTDDLEVTDLVSHLVLGRAYLVQ